MKAWEIMSTALVKITRDTALTKARMLFRKKGNRIAVVYDSLPEGKYLGFINRRDIITLTSVRSDRTVRDLIRGYPKIYKDTELEDIVKMLSKFNVYACPVLESPIDEQAIGIVSYKQIIRALKNSGIIPRAKAAGEIMTQDYLDLFVIPQKERITKAWARLVNKGIPGLVVVRDEQILKPVGILTPTDLIESGRWYFRRESEHAITTPARVRKIMKRGVVVAYRDTPIEVLADFIIQYDFSIIPVVNKRGSLIGIVTQEDVVRGYLEGRKPGRRPIRIVPVPIPVTEKELPVYLPKPQILGQVLIQKEKMRVSGITVSDIAEPGIPAIKINDTVEHARNVMLRNKVNHVLVIDNEGKILGSISKRQLLYALGIRGPLWRRRTFEKQFIFEVINENVPIVRANMSIEEAAKLMVLSDSDIILVVDEKGMFKGIITKDTLVKGFLAIKDLDTVVGNLITPSKISIVHPDHSLAHAVRRMRAYYLDALAVVDGNNLLGVLSENRLPFLALEDARTGLRSRRLLWVRRLERGGRKQGRYIKITPLLVRDALTPFKRVVSINENVRKAIQLMIENDIDGIPVVDNKGSILGAVCKNDIVRELARAGPEKIIKERKEVRINV